MRFLRLERDRYIPSFTELYSKLSKLLAKFGWLVFDHTLTVYNTELITHFAKAEDVLASTCMDPY